MNTRPIITSICVPRVCSITARSLLWSASRATRGDTYAVRHKRGYQATTSFVRFRSWAPRHYFPDSYCKFALSVMRYWLGSSSLFVFSAWRHTRVGIREVLFIFVSRVFCLARDEAIQEVLLVCLRLFMVDCSLVLREQKCNAFEPDVAPTAQC